MKLDELVHEQLKQVGMPEPKKRMPFNGAKVLISMDQPEGWTDSSAEYAAPHETDSAYPRVFRVSKSWRTPPPVIFGKQKISEKETLDHIFPAGVVGTENIGLPPRIAALTQALRDRDIDPANHDHVQRFQDLVTDTLMLFLPLVYGRILMDNGLSDRAARMEVSYCSLNEGTPAAHHRLSDAFKDSADDPNAIEHKVQAIGGGVSRALVLPPKQYEPLILDVKGPKDTDLEMVFVAIHRGGILPSIIGQYIAKEFGIDSHIIGADAKRKNASKSHFDKVVGAVLTPPAGYRESQHSLLVDGAFVCPAGLDFATGRKKVHLFVDPMLATGVSSVATIKHYMQTTRCRPESVYVVSLFAGAYEGLNRLHEMGVNVITLMHDQCDLTSNGYIQVGLGDAGDKLSMSERNDTHAILRHMQHLAIKRNDPLLARCIHDYCLQITGYGLKSMQQFMGMKENTGQIIEYAR